MYKGIYISLSGAVTMQSHMDMVTQNIANSMTPGYKKERMSFKDYIIPADNKSPLMPDGRAMSEISSVMTDFSKGIVMRTGNPLDAAINDNGFFVLEGNKYTRGGSFRISDEGYLTTQDGVNVMGSGGPIAVKGSRIDISASGEISVDGLPVDTLRIVDFSDKSKLAKLNGGVFISSENGEDVRPQVLQGYLETSNVEVIKEMVQMITTLRDFESYQRMIHAFDEAASKVTNEMAKM